MTALVKMQRDGKTADVHPDEVKNYTLGGWMPVEIAKPAAKRRSVKKPTASDKTAE